MLRCAPGGVKAKHQSLRFRINQPVTFALCRSMLLDAAVLAAVESLAPAQRIRPAAYGGQCRAL
jgi:hypothetical protein